ncbi:MAG TPA: hypothetical protein VFF31_28900 [Blastocatellia bacterium]|nr:hypothetical protein [Blastocatellia bacterium]
MHDLTIAKKSDWEELHKRGLRVIVDPLIYRLGQIFLEGEHAAGDKKNVRWHAVEGDLGALVSFFDLIVLNDQLPAFNYTDTFDMGLNFDDSLGALVNRGDKTLVSVNVDYEPYMTAKQAAVEQLRSRMADGPFVGEATARDIITSLAAVEYQWEPSLLGLENELPNAKDVVVARFLGGVLVFAGYAQQTGAPHVLSPRRSRLVTAASIPADSADPAIEADVYKEVRRRLRDGGAGWREWDVPWTPSFLPYLLSRMNLYKEGPDILLERAKELRSRPAVKRYRELRESIASEDADRSTEAIKELTAAADIMTRELDSNRQELELTRSMFVEVLPKAVGVVVGVAGGGLVAGPPGAIAGGLVGLVGEEALKAVQRRLWGWVIDRLPFRSARKLLTRSVRAEHELSSNLGTKLRTVWETGPRKV